MGSRAARGLRHQKKGARVVCMEVGIVVVVVGVVVEVDDVDLEDNKG